MRRYLTFGLISVSFFASCSLRGTDEDSLSGAWTVAEITYRDAAGEDRITDPQPGLLIFSDRHYSFVWTLTAEPRKPFRTFTEPTTEEIRAAFNSIVVNAGEYEVSDDRLITRPIISRIPGFSGGYAVYEFILEGETLDLTMTDEYDRNGTQATWARQGRSTVFRLQRTG